MGRENFISFQMTDEEENIVVDFSCEQADACRGNWLEGRYYSQDGEKVRKFLSFDEVFDICPFEVGVNRRPARRRHRELLERVVTLLDIGELMSRSFHSLSNGEMRRVLFARAILKRPRHLTLISPMEGIDAERRKMFAAAIDELRRDGFDISVKGNTVSEEAAEIKPKKKNKKNSASSKSGKVVVEMKDVTIKLGRRILFKNLSWTLRQGERWLLKGPNGSGKTTLLALISGSSPLAYANDIKVFGVPRANGFDLSRVRKRIAVVGPEMQSYLDMNPEEMVDEAFAKNPDLILLDEPCFNLDERKAKRLVSHIEGWLDEHPSVTAICVAHCSAHVPSGFDKVLELAP